jgi:HlyD family secretion protein
MTLADMSIITAEVKVDETDIVNIALGQSADVSVDAIPGKVFKGHVTLAGDQALLRSTGQATSTQTSGTEEAKDFKVVITLDDPSNNLSDLRPGLSTTAKITTAHKANVVTLPIQALTLRPAETAGKGTVQAASASASGANKTPDQGVYVVTEDSHHKLRAKFVAVATGITGATDIEVTNGLKAGDEIVIGPFKTLRDLKDNALIKRDTAPATPVASGS